MRVLICGGGIAGLTLAGCLERCGMAPLLVERAGQLRDQGYMVDFFGSGYEVSAHLGLLHELNQIHYPVTSLTFVDRRGRVRLSLPYPLLRRRLFDDRHLNFLRGDLERLLYDRIAHRVEMRFGVTVETIVQRTSGVVARLSDGSDQECDLLFCDPVSQIEVPRWSAGRVVLLGDACQCVSLLAGQGAGMAMTGAYVLAEELARSSDVTAALARYEARLRPGIQRLQAAGRRIATWFLPETPVRLALRNLALRTSAWPIAAGVLRRRIAAVSVLGA